jgi:hypothetical protein
MEELGGGSVGLAKLVDRFPECGRIIYTVYLVLGQASNQGNIIIEKNVYRIFLVPVVSMEMGLTRGGGGFSCEVGH